MRDSSKIGAWSAGALVVANMIGTGVFSSLGFQLIDTQNSWSIVLLWAIGGVIALAGALSYAESGAFFRRSGGEYHFLSQLYHPLIGYLSGWVSLTVGFAAPVALAAMALGAYVQAATDIPARLPALLAILVASALHSFTIRQSSSVQNWITLLKVVLVIGFIIAGLGVAAENNALDWSAGWTDEIMLPAFAVSLVYVTYAYTGWNAAAYIVEEIRQPERNLPKGLIVGTLLVTLLYILLQFVFLANASLAQLTGQLEVGQIVAGNLFGATLGNQISLVIALFLFSSISAMVWVGPRVSQMMAEDYRIWRFLRPKTAAGVPLRAVWFQSALSAAFILTGTFEQILIFSGFILQLFSALTVGGSFLLRKKGYDLPFRNPFHPLLTLVFLGASAWILVFLLIEQPLETGLGFGIVVLGAISYFISKNIPS
ncbi:MAG: amino acid permease [Saprospiraceae bacterium]|nr:amino acid permease [Saprospiraceae bacterium]MDP4999049.1 amino acid permease [Saprospiraceae bacterium]